MATIRLGEAEEEQDIVRRVFDEVTMELDFSDILELVELLVRWVRDDIF